MVGMLTMLLSVVATAEASPHPLNPLSEMVAVDQSLLRQLTLEGVYQQSGFFDLPSQIIQWKLISAGEKFLAQQIVQEILAPPARGSLRMSMPRDAESPRSATLEVLDLLTAEGAARCQLFAPKGYTSIEVQDLLEQELFRHVYLVGDDQYKLQHPWYKLLWSCGRGFAEKLNNISEVTQLDSGLISVAGEGVAVSPQMQGIWTLEVDPAKQWLVRKAVFRTVAEPEEIYLEIRTSGIIEDGLVPVAASAEYFFRGEGSEIQQIECFSARGAADPAEFDLARKLVYGPYAIRTTVMDGQLLPSPSTEYAAGEQYLPTISEKRVP